MAIAITKKSKTKKKIAAKKATKKKAAKKTNTKTVTPQNSHGAFKQLDYVLTEIAQQLEFLRKDFNEVKTLLASHSSITQTTTQVSDVSKTETQTNLFDNQSNSNSGTTLTKEDVSQALQEVMTVAGQDEVKSILASVKVIRVSEIKEVDYQTIIEACNTAIGSLPATNEATQEANPATSLF